MLRRKKFLKLDSRFHGNDDVLLDAGLSLCSRLDSTTYVHVGVPGNDDAYWILAGASMTQK